MWWSYLIVGGIGFAWLCVYWLAIQGAFSLISVSGKTNPNGSKEDAHSTSISPPSVEPMQSIPEKTTDKKLKESHAPVYKPPEKKSEPQPTNVVTNPTGSIINQSSEINAPQTVNNFGPPTRRIPADSKESLVAILSKSPGDIVIVSVSDDSEAAQFARDWAELLRSSGWRIQATGTLNTNDPWHGVQVVMDGPKQSPDSQIKVLSDSPVYGLVDVLKTLRTNPLYITVEPRWPRPPTPPGTIRLEIGLRPEDTGIVKPHPEPLP